MRFLKKLREGISGEIIQEIYDYYEPQFNKIKRKYDRYRAENLPIHNRDYGELEPEIDAQLNNDFFGEIIGLKVGHFAGKAASYSYDKTRPERDRAYDVLSRFQMVNNLAYIDSQTTKDAAIAGKAYRLLYINPENELRVTVLKPYEVVVFYEHDPTESEFAIRFYPVENDEGKQIIHADVYDKTHMYEYIQGKESFEIEKERLHQFIHCPIIMYRNNDEEMGDADNVLSLIDAYDYTTSDLNAEITAFRLAYFAFFGAQIDEGNAKEFKKTGAFNLPLGADAKFITKDLNVAPIDSHLNRLREDIYNFSNTPNLRDSSFGGNASGVSLRYKLSGIESKCLTFERIKNNADTRMFKVATTFWERKDKVQFDPYSVIVEHYRNVPIDLKEIADAMKQYIDMGLPLEFLLTQMPFIDDPEYVMDLVRKEQEEFGGSNEKITPPVLTDDHKNNNEIDNEERLVEQ